MSVRRLVSQEIQDSRRAVVRQRAITKRRHLSANSTVLRIQMRGGVSPGGVPGLRSGTLNSGRQRYEVGDRCGRPKAQAATMHLVETVPSFT